MYVRTTEGLIEKKLGCLLLKTVEELRAFELDEERKLLEFEATIA
jgi:hypothetical protein